MATLIRTGRDPLAIAIPVIAGTLFGAGLALGGMTDPVVVRGFLDLFGQWNPTLAFVMGGALLVMVIAWRVKRRLEHPVFAERFVVPKRGAIDARLLLGAAIFGVGWGLAGLCPGPGFAALALAPLSALPFLAAMFAGMILHRLLLERKGEK